MIIETWGGLEWSCDRKCTCGHVVTIFSDAYNAAKPNGHQQACGKCGKKEVYSLASWFKMTFGGAFDILHATKKQMLKEDVIEHDFDPCYVFEHRDHDADADDDVTFCDEPHLFADLIFATKLGMTDMIDTLIPLTVRLSKRYNQHREMHQALVKYNGKVACRWAALAFEAMADADEGTTYN